MPFLEALFDLNGTRTRKQALRVFLVLLAAFVVVLVVRQVMPTAERFVIPVFGGISVWWWATVVRRLHDAGYSGAWAILMLVPVVGLIVTAAALILRSDRPFNNSHAGLRAMGTVGLVLVAIFWLSRAFWAPYWSPAESMKPTLLTGDYQITRYVDAENLERGDVVVFRHPVKTDTTMVKRLIGLPGDSVQIIGGQVTLNGASLPLEAAGKMTEIYQPQGPSALLPRCSNAVVGVGGICETNLSRETLPEGRAYLVGNIEDGSFPDNMGPFVVPEGHLFFLGDNRDNSLDSRFAQGAGGLGFVPAENVIGRVTRVLFSAEGASLWAIWTWRGDRLFRPVE